MESALEISAFNRAIEPVMKLALPEKAKEVSEFRADPELQDRIERLARKSTEGALSDTEKAEYAGYVRANKFVAILKRQARTMISHPSLRTRLETTIDQMLDGNIMLDEALAEFENLYIQRAFTRNKKRISLTALALGVHKNTLAKRVKPSLSSGRRKRQSDTPQRKAS
ncbi:MAG: hypothetical protein ACXWID_10725 [Pyrinomonadaceae bacterium]